MKIDIQTEVPMIVLNYLRDELHKRLDEEIAKHPEAEKDREVLYGQLLDYVNVHGVIPEFSLERRGDDPDDWMDECGYIPGVGLCTLAGTEHCDWDCPFNPCDPEGM